MVRNTTSQPKQDLVRQDQWLPDGHESMEVDHASSKDYSAAGAGGAESTSRPAPMYEDGKYGFGNQAGGRAYDDGRFSDRSRDQQGGLVSDGMMQDYYGGDRRHHGRR
jgi:hypothetical protein